MREENELCIEFMLQAFAQRSSGRLCLSSSQISVTSALNITRYIFIAFPPSYELPPALQQNVLLSDPNRGPQSSSLTCGPFREGREEGFGLSQGW